MAAPPLIVQTTYAELLERCAAAALAESFPDEGTFTSKTVKGRRYWYFQASASQGRAQRYVGPESPELLERIGQHRDARHDERERRALVSTLVRSFGLPSPLPAIGDVIAALARAGVFRLRGVLVGTMAYQTYSAMLGFRLPGALLQTSDIDVAQFSSVSIAVGDRTEQMTSVLKEVDKTFREVPHLSSRQHFTSYVAKGGLRVDFLTPNQGPDTDDAQHLPALNTAAQPLRFLDFLIHDAVEAVLLYGPGIVVRVPLPERFAVHKLILSERRPASSAKSDKDAMQAGALLEALAEKRPHDLRAAWEEAYERGPKWRQLLLGGLWNLSAKARDLTLLALGKTRGFIPELRLTFEDSPLRYDTTTDAVILMAREQGGPVQCVISREALDDHFGTDHEGTEGRVAAVRRHRSKFEDLLQRKFLEARIEEPQRVVLKTRDIAG